MSSWESTWTENEYSCILAYSATLAGDYTATIGHKHTFSDASGIVRMGLQLSRQQEIFWYAEIPTACTERELRDNKEQNGLMYQNCWRVKHSYSASYNHYRKVAEQGNNKAQAGLVYL